MSNQASAKTIGGHIEYYRDLIFVLLMKEFIVRYKNTVLGYVWSLLHPLLFMTVYVFVFKVVLKVPIENYVLFILPGVFFWQAFQNSLCTSSLAFVSNSSLIKKLMFPQECLILAGVLNDLLHFIFSIPIIFLVMTFYQISPSMDWFWKIPLFLMIQLIMTCGFALIVATCNLFLRDLERLISIIVMLWFYVTPILFKSDWLPAQFKWIVFANPVAGLVINWRNLFMGEATDPSLLWCSIAWAIVAFSSGYLTYYKLRRKFSENV